MQWRHAWIALSLLSPAAYSQQPAGFRPDVSFVIREHAMGADMVEVTAIRAEYPAELLRRQLEDLGARLGSPPRGLEVGAVSLDAANPNLKFVKARFAIDGLIDRGKGVLRVQPILQALAGAPEPNTVNSVLILFDGEKPGPRTVQRHVSDSVDAEGTVTAKPALIEYRIRLKSQNAEMIDFPDQVPEQRTPAKPSEGRSGTPVLFWGAIAVAGVAAGALVYLALLRGGSRGTERR